MNLRGVSANWHPSNLLVAQQPALDAHWHRLLLECLLLPDSLYAYLMPETERLASLRRRFEASGHTDLPLLSPPEVYRQQCEDSLERLNKLRQMIATQEADEHIRVLYLARIDELVLNCRMWLAAADHDYATFEAANVLVYGEPDPTIFAAECAWLRIFADAQLKHPDPRIRLVAERVLVAVPNLSGRPDLLIPDEQTYHSMRTLHTMPGGYFPQLFNSADVPTQAVATTDGDAILRRVLKNIDATYTIVDATDTFWGVAHDIGAVLRPASYSLAPAGFTGIIAHEVGSHLLERVNGFRGPLQLAATGLAHYEWGNEGRAYMREQLALGSTQAMQQHYSWEFNITQHLAISLAVGTIIKRHDFGEIYSVINAVYLLWALLQNEGPEAAAANAADESWACVSRVLKGTDGRHGAYYKDIVYMEGNVRCWKLAKENPERIFWGDAGKFDITNQEHIRHLRALGVL